MADDWIKHFETRFVDAARTCALADTLTSRGTLAAYFETTLGYVDYAEYQKLAKKIVDDNKKGPPRSVSTAHDNSLALAPLHFTYMDVGCWAGSGNDKMWPRHREFGVVYGPIVVLCAFAAKPAEYARYGSPPSWEAFGSAVTTHAIDATIRKHPRWEPVGDLLDSLARIFKEKLHLHILGTTTVVSPYVPTPSCGPKDPIMVFIGDLHAPVVTRPSDAHLTDLGREMLRGRLDINSVLEMIPPGILPPAAILNVAEKVVEACGKMDWNRTTSAPSMDRWFDLYHGQQKQRGADIFETAGADLRRFVDALAAFHGETHPLEVVQLGDFFDLWLGFQCAFEGNADGLFGDAFEFARHWVDRTLFHTEQGAHLVHFLTMGQWADKNEQTGARLATHFLYGNHDNYRKHGAANVLTVPPGREHAGLEIQPFPAPSSLDRPGLWAEHGHQADESNRDESPGVGYMATQAAFFMPAVRSLEGPYGWLKSLLDKEGLIRVREIKHALDCCLLDNRKPSAECRGIYVMGHSHEPMLKRVEFWPRTPPGRQ